MNGLIIKKYYLDMILAGEKTWEIRGSNTKKRGAIALIESGSGLVVGTCLLVNSKRLTTKDIEPNINKHKLSKVDRFFLHYKKPHAWVLNNAKRIDHVEYKHPRGAIIWVKNVIRTDDIHYKIGSIK